MQNIEVVYEPTATGFSAYVPILPGCVATGRTLDEAKRNIRDAVTAHIELMREHGESVPDVVWLDQVPAAALVSLSAPTVSAVLSGTGFRQTANFEHVSFQPVT